MATLAPLSRHLGEQLREAHEERRILREENARLRAALAAAQQDLQTLRSMAADWRAQVEQAEEVIATMEAELELLADRQRKEGGS
jgi:chromosome segregation ATPase